MQFKLEGASIHCIRKHKSRKTNKINEEVVVSFDSHLKEVAPHVAARLTEDEIFSLRHWLKEREQINQEPTAQNLLEALPDVIEKATEALAELDHLDKITYDKLVNMIEIFLSKIKQYDDVCDSSHIEFTEMDQNQVLAERIHQVKKDLT
ncbi:hypothetical protein [Spartinivicinus poritis]|uniref:Uncharacterized protein n=1 Tax=Spartinivicinus poritis TaxID=2994640 RepID=A0ABT5UCQ8_9GAMM|nr:hypothetical protein [Spartinivicinus sp. A2-2]MDE1464163.1 hypothetical protein [Spartinivicinus sp. A2-2]